MYSSAYKAESHLQDLVPNVTSDEINSVLSTACVNVDVAAKHLLGIKISLFYFSNPLLCYNICNHIYTLSLIFCILGLNDVSNDFHLENGGNESCANDEKLFQFRMIIAYQHNWRHLLEMLRKDIIDKSTPRQRFVVSREDGSEEFLGSYKNPKVRLTDKPCVKFKGKECDGSRPVRVFSLRFENCRGGT